MRGLRSLSVAALCLVSLMTGGIVARLVFLILQPRSGSVLVGMTVLILGVLWGTTRTQPAATSYW